MSRPAPRELTVLRRHQLTTNMLRLTLGGPGMESFPADQASAYIKLMLPAQGQSRPVVRTYTVRAQRDQEIDVDFVTHADAGPASSWAMQARVGDRILVGGPGPKKMIDHSADWFLLVGDMTALPAISANLEQLPQDASGHAIIEVIDRTDIQELSAPDNLKIHWLLNPHPGCAPELLLNRVRELDWPGRRPAVWCACEFSAMRNLRDHFRSRQDLDRSNLYISSYWKLGAIEEEHKALKAAVA
ncbi:siderophore-interacting protein [Marinobacterium nitratireducens]|uniref:Siderophore-interacting protein n=1 Tax=Marinobacterium nitratireducens TaxID=518897 RepID=A0A917ZED2_9GAMM|nr:siderophore-interacting protein [Marinobacterium nitratireducens]GGO80297.1 siderophore-interacting protein [Marinobacterium nitratireducens]